MPEETRLATLLKVAELYHVRRLTQREIATSLGCSPSTVSRLLQEAVEGGLVEVRIRNPWTEADELSQALAQKFGLQRAVVVAGNFADDAAARQAIGSRAAALLTELVRDGDVVGLSWGRTLSAMVGALRPGPEYPSLSVIPLIGGLGQSNPYLQVNELASRFAQGFQAKPFVIHAPALVKAEYTKRLFLEEHGIRDVAERWSQLTVAFVGVGSPVATSSLVRTGLYTPGEVAELAAMGAVGDVCGRFFDEQGRECQTSANARLIAVGFDQLRRVDRLVGLGGGFGKAASLAAAARGGLYNILVTDETTARTMLASQ